ncbi:hypothetical protein F4560_006810 [Saccharothrix ecbatanensis]|uniref:Uncharacterized protein n=1 Tax=Saccharothrix ecbatanensis TaxID=1105145 RepID=A0A7W9M4F2_9PSEU|nr:hypothetical protein [Saccharothrix ecbatanensis]MBB5807042.1 hypothetical protein [Saccharothrix ecbatanensis]
MDPLTTIITSPILLTLVVTLGYAVSCAVWPFKRCRACSGAGHHKSRVIRAYRPCRRCGGSGMRLRIGRKAWNAFTRTRRNRRDHRRNPNSQRNQGT